MTKRKYSNRRMAISGVICGLIIAGTAAPCIVFPEKAAEIVIRVAGACGVVLGLWAVGYFSWFGWRGELGG